MTTIPNTPPGNSGMNADLFHPNIPGLLRCHFDQLHTGSGIAPEVIEERGYVSVRTRDELARYGFGRVQFCSQGLVLPVCPPDGTNGLYVYRPDIPPVGKDGKARKYLLPAKSSPRLDVPPRCRPMLNDRSVRVWIVEGQKKADALASYGLCAVALLGVWLFRGKDEHGGSHLLADFELIPWNEREAPIAFDSDIVHKAGVKQAMDRIAAVLQNRRSTVRTVYLPPGPGGAKVGVDDYLLTHSITELEALLGAPKPKAEAATPVVELLDEAPPSLRRPLAIVGDQSYAAAWLHTRTTITETVDKHGNLERHDPPKVKTTRALHVVRGDGALFGTAAACALDDLGIDVDALRDHDPPQEEKLWRAPAVVRYGAGQRPDVADVFERITGAFNHFIHFQRSFAEQREMCRLSACFSLATWFSAAFTVMGYPWPNGEKGSGKSHWGQVWASTSYLGSMISSTGSFAALRDLANYGAALVFDDAEAMADPKKADPNKRELLLAGNRAGVSIPLKEQDGDGRWHTVWVNAFCPKAFTAIRLPDHVLASRSVIIPLVRTADPKRGNRDPADTKRWPCNQRQLQDDLWAMALWLLPEAERIWAKLDDEEALVGREFEPWRAVLAVARLLEAHGVTDLEQGIRTIITAYQDEKADLLEGDWTATLIKALLRLVPADRDDTSDTSDTHDTSSEGGGTSTCVLTVLTSSRIAREIQDDGKRDTEVFGEPTSSWATPSRVGRLMQHLRFRRPKRTAEERGWYVSRGDVEALARSYGLLDYPMRSEDGARESQHRQNARRDTPPPKPSVMSVIDDAPAAEEWCVQCAALTSGGRSVPANGKTLLGEPLCRMHLLLAGQASVVAPAAPPDPAPGQSSDPSNPSQRRYREVL